MKEISVIMSAYNCQHTISRAVESILQQTFRNLEFIIVDDGSTDATFEVLENYKNRDDRIILISQAKKGLTHSLNQALKIARGEFVVRQDADDESLPERIERQLKFIKENNLDIIGSYAYLVNEKGSMVKKMIRPITHNVIAAKLEQENCILHSTVVYRRKAVVSIGGYKKDYEYAQDYDLFLRAIRHGLKLGCIPQVLVRITHSHSSVSVKRRRIQLLYAISAQSRHFAKQERFKFRYILYILSHISKILIPMFIRRLRVWLMNNLHKRR